MAFYVLFVCAAGALQWPYCLAYNLSIALVLCAAWLFLQRRLCAHLLHWSVLYWRLCAECFMLPRDGVHCRWIERAAALLLECVYAGWQWSCWLFGWFWYIGNDEFSRGHSRSFRWRHNTRFLLMAQIVL